MGSTQYQRGLTTQGSTYTTFHTLRSNFHRFYLSNLNNFTFIHIDRHVTVFLDLALVVRCHLGLTIQTTRLLWRHWRGEDQRCWRREVQGRKGKKD